MPYLKAISFLLKQKSISDLQIAEKLNITKEQVSAYVNQLRLLGKHIDIADHGTYKIFSSIILLDLFVIQEKFTEEALRHVNRIKLFNKISSTSEYLKKINNDVQLVIAEEQTAGQGRLGRTWISPFGCNIYLSLLWELDSTLAGIDGLSVVVGCSLLETLKRFSSQNLQLKWPNDLVWNNKKIAGILVDLVPKNTNLYAVIGVGINVNYKPELPAVSSLRDIEKKYFDRNVIISYIVNDLVFYLSTYAKYGINSFVKEWQNYDGLYKQNIVILLRDGSVILGKNLGIDFKGRLIIEKKNKQIVYLASGECSIYRS